ncbi:MAG: Nif3-like dinuclear metal center hexameric protein [Proteobacteria bacterium]|nr:Nif3-like dinuclear metal center hexameric protein [Pseudomonadota bacterium]MBU1736970.1 Nif3-like dinuclear metal center hexameric protein [Pseudomonadota bacterium]
MPKQAVVLKDLLCLLEEIAASDLAEPWDNVGLMVGDPNQIVSGVLVALDPTEDVLVEAVNLGCNVLLTHHPLIFKPMKALVLDTYPGRLLAKAVTDGIAVVGCHTNLDKTAGGVNDALAKAIGLSDCGGLEVDNDENPGAGFGRIGRLSPARSFDAFSSGLMKALDLPVLRIAGPKPLQVEWVAVCGGSGSDLAEKACAAGAQVYVTGEVKHSTARWAEDAGFCVIDAGHYSTENMVVPALASLVRSRMQEKGVEINVKETGIQTSPFRVVFRDQGTV